MRLIPGPRESYMFTKEIVVTIYALNPWHNQAAGTALASCRHFDVIIYSNIVYSFVPKL